MLSELTPWLELALRWAHVIAGISWIGTSFYFIWLDNSLRPPARPKPGVGGELWAVHGGGFYHKQKYVVAPETLPAELHWFKWEAYFTWISGFLLLAVIYYLGANIFLIDRSKLALTQFEAIGISLGFLIGGWLVYDGLCRSPFGKSPALFGAAWYLTLVAATYALTRIFSDRGAFIHVGAVIGTAMAANVFMVIIPNQRKATAAMLAGAAPDPKLGLQAKQRSLHNNYMTLPVVLIMISGHYPMLFGAALNWLLLAGLGLVGVLIRHFFNLKNRGEVNYLWLVGATAVFAAMAIVANDSKPRPQTAAATSFTAAQNIVERHCVACHSAHPSHVGIATAPAGIDFTQPDAMQQHAQQILQQAVLTNSMPLGDETGMTAEERRKLGDWIRAGAHGETAP